MSRLARLAANSFSPLHTMLAHPQLGVSSLRTLAMLDVLRRRGRHWGLLAQYEENRLRLAR